MWHQGNLKKLVWFDAKHFGLWSNVLVNPCHPWSCCSLFRELVMESHDKNYWSLSDSQLCAPLLVPKCPVLLDGSLHPLNYNLTAVVEEGAA